MRLLATSDWHLDATTAGLDRGGEVQAYAQHLCEVVKREEVDVVLHGGDLFDPGHLRESTYHRVLLRSASALTKAAWHGSIWLAGNHDVLDEAEPSTTLSALAEAARVCEGPDPQHLYSVYRDSDGVFARVRVAELPRVVELTGERPGGVAVLCLPYVSRAAMNTEAYRVAYAGAFERARSWEGKLVVLSHLSLPNMHPGSEEEMPRGREVDFPVREVLALRPAVVLQGHYHARQTVKVDGLVVEVVGAPVRFTFGERNDGARGYLLVDV